MISWAIRYRSSIETSFSSVSLLLCFFRCLDDGIGIPCFDKVSVSNALITKKNCKNTLKIIPHLLIPFVLDSCTSFLDSTTPQMNEIGLLFSQVCSTSNHCTHLCYYYSIVKNGLGMTNSAAFQTPKCRRCRDETGRTGIFK